MIKPQVILFDFDGTLADTLPACIRSLQRIFEEFDGLVYGGEEIVSMFGPPEDGIIRLHLKNRARVDEAVETFYRYYKEEHPARAAEISGMRELIGRIRSLGLRTGIVTGKGRVSLNISLAYFGMAGYFDVEITGNDVLRPKPDPEGVLAALSALGCTPQNAVFVGDSVADIRAGLGAGVPTFGAHWCENVQSASFSVEPDKIFKNIQDFKDYLEHMGYD